jgi:hypothetical protein
LPELDDFPVPPKSIKDIEGSAASCRGKLPSPSEPSPDVMGLATYLGEHAENSFVIEAVPDEQMGRAAAYVSKDSKRILIKQTVFHAANYGDSDANFIVAHELGHLVLGHTKLHARQMNRMVDGNIKVNFIREPESAELQASAWARAFLMPLEIVQKVKSPEQLAGLCKVPLNQARLRWREVREFLSGPRRSLDVVAPIPARQNIAGARRVSPANAAWDKALPIAGEDPAEFRQTRNGFRIKYSEYERRTQMGWFVRNGEAISDLDDRNR